MSEQEKPKSFMEKLDQWTETMVVNPLVLAVDQEMAVEAIKKTIREKVLESYHNGQKAGPRKPARKEACR